MAFAGGLFGVVLGNSFINEFYTAYPVNNRYWQVSICPTAPLQVLYRSVHVDVLLLSEVGNLHPVHICILLLAEESNGEDKKQPVLFLLFHTCA